MIWRGLLSLDLKALSRKGLGAKGALKNGSGLIKLKCPETCSKKGLGFTDGGYEDLSFCRAENCSSLSLGLGCVYLFLCNFIRILS